MNIPLIIKKAKISDLHEIMLLHNEISIYFKNIGLTHWNNEYPNKEVFIKDIKIGSQYIAKDGRKIAGIISFDRYGHPLFDSVKYFDNKEYYFIHRLAVSPKYHNKGIGKFLMNYAENTIRDNRGTSIRLGAFSKYEKVLSFYKKLNYKTVGEVTFKVSNYPFLIMEKIL